MEKAKQIITKFTERIMGYINAKNGEITYSVINSSNENNLISFYFDPNVDDKLTLLTMDLNKYLWNCMREIKIYTDQEKDINSITEGYKVKIIPTLEFLSNPYADMEYFYNEEHSYDFVEMRTVYLFKGNDYLYEKNKVPDYTTWFGDFNLAKLYGPVVAYQTKKPLKLLNLSSPTNFLFLHNNFDPTEIDLDKEVFIDQKKMKLSEMIKDNLNITKISNLTQNFKQILNNSYRLLKKNNNLSIIINSTMFNDVLLAHLTCHILKNNNLDGWYHPCMQGRNNYSLDEETKTEYWFKFPYDAEVLLCNPEKLLFNPVKLL